ncbi:MAG: SdpI family protein [Patescibacteria group bacterium]
MKYFTLILILVTVVVTFYIYPSLPAKMPTHWNFQGNIDAYSPKLFAAWLMPAIAIAMLIMFELVPKFDPKKEKYKLFEKEWMIMANGIIIFMIYMHTIMMYASMHIETNIMKPMFVGMGILFILIGNYLSKIRHNYFIGIRTPWALESEENWNKTHRFASWTFVLAGIIVFLEAFFLWYASAMIFGSIMIAAILPIIYSYLVYIKKPIYIRYVILGLFALILAFVLLRFSTPEDTWICDNGKWVPHGHPTVAPPSTICK